MLVCTFLFVCVCGFGASLMRFCVLVCVVVCVIYVCDIYFRCVLGVLFCVGCLCVFCMCAVYVCCA